MKGEGPERASTDTPIGKRPPARAVIRSRPYRASVTGPSLTGNIAPLAAVVNRREVNSPVVRGARMDSAISKIAQALGAAEGWAKALGRTWMRPEFVEGLTKEQRQLLDDATDNLTAASRKLEALWRELENERR